MMIWSETETGRGYVTVSVPDQGTLLEDIGARLRRGEGFSVATLNLDHVVKLQHDPAFRAAYGDHTHITADGNPIVWLSRLAGQRDVALVQGSELIEPVAALAADAGAPVALFGATTASLEAAATALVERHPALNIALIMAPGMGFDPDGAEADAAMAAIAQSGARVVFLALGAPRQERFAARAQTALPGIGFLSIGAGLDFISGAQTRAPAWVRLLSCEWLWRMLGNPRRLAGRYGACAAALPGLTMRAFGKRRSRRAS